MCEEENNLLNETVTADMVRPKKIRRGKNKQNPGRKIRNPELEAYSLNFVREGILKTGKRIFKSSPLSIFFHYKAPNKILHFSNSNIRQKSKKKGYNPPHLKL